MFASGTIFDLKKFAIHDGPGIRTTVFFKGCPLDCWWCHNPEGLRAEPEVLSVRVHGDVKSPHRREKKDMVGRRVTVAEVMEEVEKDVVFYQQSGGGATFSGGEPLMQEDFLVSLLEECRSKRIETAVDTSGYAPWRIFDRIAGLVEMFLYDLKFIDDEEHQKFTGVSNDIILENLSRLSQRTAKIIVRVPLIPGITDTGANIGAIAGFLEPLQGVHELDLLPYNKLSEDKFRRFNITSKAGHLPCQTDTELNEKVKLFESCGYKVKIGG
jgi:pyruvate formate lyase activating enzyme